MLRSLAPAPWKCILRRVRGGLTPRWRLLCLVQPFLEPAGCLGWGWGAEAGLRGAGPGRVQCQQLPALQMLVGAAGVCSPPGICTLEPSTGAGENLRSLRAFRVFKNLR